MDTITRLREEEAQLGRVRSPYLEAGPQGPEEAAVFVHGNPGSSRDCEDLVRRVDAFGRAVAPDMPGYRRADKPEDFDYTPDGYARPGRVPKNHTARPSSLASAYGGVPISMAFSPSVGPCLSEKHRAAQSEAYPLCGLVPDLFRRTSENPPSTHPGA